MPSEYNELSLFLNSLLVYFAACKVNHFVFGVWQALPLNSSAFLCVVGGKGRIFFFHLYNAQRYPQHKSLLCCPRTGSDMTVLHILCSLPFPSILPNSCDMRTTSCFERPGCVSFRSSLSPPCSGSLTQYLSKCSLPIEVQWDISIPLGRGGWLFWSLPQHKDLVSSVTPTLTEDEIKVRLVGRKGGRGVVASLQTTGLPKCN